MSPESGTKEKAAAATQEPAVQSPDLVYLQTSAVEREFARYICGRCPAAGDGVFEKDGRQVLFCNLQGALLSGDVAEAAKTTRYVRAELGMEPGCPPYNAGKKATVFADAFATAVKDGEREMP